MRRMVSLVGLAVAFLTTPVSAQGWDIGFGIGGGASLPLGDFADVADAGWHTGLAIELRREGTPFAVRFTGDFHRLGLAEEVEDALGSTGSVELWRWGIDGVWYLSEPGDLVPFVTGGLGILNGDVSVDDFEGSTGVFQDDTRFTFGAGIGVYVGLTEGLGLAFESRYQLATGEAPRPSIFPLTVRLTF